MRILAIRGENLASLGQPFVLDFEAEPLASAGLFAITGHTGSGKSTILDALCLALYGKYPRFAEQQTDSSPDPGGTVRILDGSAILRRGAGQGYAETDFLGRDGLRYRARWEARRSRNRADGAVQDARRTLYSIEPDSLVALATSKTEVRDAVHDKTGLTFEQFCRTVLLAQGQFDSFLLADKHERGELLEKLTGTEIYGRISQRVRGSTKVLEQEVAELEQRRTAMGLLGPSERSALTAELDGLRAELDSKAGEVNGVQDKLNRIDALTAAQTRFKEAEEVVDAAQRKQDEAAPVRQQSAEFTAAEALRALWMQSSKAEDALPAAIDADARARAEFENTAAQALTAANALGEVQARSDEAERVFKASGPIWSEAEQLDARIAAACDELDCAAEQATGRHATEERIVGDLSALESELAQVLVDLEVAQQQLAACAHQVSLVDRLSEFESLFARHETAWTDSLAANELAKQGQREAEQLQAKASQIEDALATDTRLLAQQTGDATRLRSELSACDQLSLEAQVEGANELAEALRNALGRARKHTAQTGRLAIISRAISKFERTAAQAAGREAEAMAKAAEWEARLAELSPLADLAEDSVDARTVALRSRTLEGEKCPVCGSEDHPYLLPGADDGLTALAAMMRERRKTLQGQLRDYEEAARVAAMEVANACGGAKLSSDQQTETSDAIGELETAYSESLASLGMLAQQLLQSTPPAVLDAAADGALQVLTEACDEWCKNVKAALQHARLLRRQLDAKEEEREATQRKLSAGEEPLRVAKADASLALLNSSRAERKSGDAALRVGSLEEQLATPLSLVGVSQEELRSDNAGALQELRHAVEAVSAARATEAELRQRASTIAVNSESKKSLHAEAARQCREADSIEQARKQTLADLEQARALLLGGEPTAVHRTRVNNARLAAQEQRNEAQSEDGRLRQQVVAADVEVAHAHTLLINAQAASLDATKDFNRSCETAGMSPDSVSALLAQPASVAAGLHAELQAVDKALGKAQAVLDECQRHVAKASVDSPDVVERVALALALSELRDSEAALNRTLGQRQEALERDTRQRAAATSLETEIGGKQVELTEWQQVDTAVGSADGHRFRQFAQSLTLEELVVLANEHLDSFSNRYHLLRSPGTELALHVVDKDMGDGERPTRSLSGGERFLVSLSLALALAGLEGRDFMVDTLFIDEGFGSLDEDTLAAATAAFETLHSRGRKVGVITHVEAMKENIATQVRVEKLGGGSSVVLVGT